MDNKVRSGYCSALYMVQRLEHGLYEFIDNGHTTKCSYFSSSLYFFTYYSLVYQQTHLSQASTAQVE